MSASRNLLRKIYRQVERILVWVLPGKMANRLQTSVPAWSNYFVAAESSTAEQWGDIIWPLIRDFDFDAVLELAPGWGRSTERLCGLANRIYAVDIDPRAIKACRQRLGNSFKGCDLVYAVNNGKDLRMIESGTISTIYCWDSAVHFSREILASYVREFSRILRARGKGFVHHSNLGKTASKNIKANPHWRSNVSKEFIAQLCRENGLIVEIQRDIKWGEIIDCATVFVKAL